MTPSSLLARMWSSESRYACRGWPRQQRVRKEVARQQRRLLPQDINCLEEFFISLKTDAPTARKKREHRPFLFLNLNLCCSITKIIEHRKNLLTTIGFVTDELAPQRS
jgi:hypothetical protein